MTFAEKIRAFIEKLQSLPEKKKKIILWTVVAILAVIMGFFWVRGAITSFSKLGESTQNIKIPQIDTSEMPILDLQPIQDQINNAPATNTNTPNNK